MNNEHGLAGAARAAAQVRNGFGLRSRLPESEYRGLGFALHLYAAQNAHKFHAASL